MLPAQMVAEIYPKSYPPLVSHANEGQAKRNMVFFYRATSSLRPGQMSINSYDVLCV